jgi:hypothetical protein
MLRHRSWIVALLLVPGVVAEVGCKKKAPTPPVSEDEFFPGHKFAGGGDDGGDEAPDWVPAEFKNGKARWKDTGVYLDGKPVGMLSFGELPFALRPVWIEEEVSAEKKYGDNSPGFKTVKQRRYRFADYFEAIGIDLANVKEVHVYGPKLTSTIIASGKEVLERRDEFMFRFGGDIEGKAIPVVPPNFGNGRRPDKISAVMVYATKKPPMLVPDEGMVLDGEAVTGVPYRGEPLRGGIRIYFDDRLAGLVKRNTLDGTRAGRETGTDGEIRWKLFPFLDAQGIDTRKIVAGWIIRDERKREKLPRGDLENATFEAAPQKKGEILLGEKKIRVHHLALHSKPVEPHDEIQPDELSILE